MGDEPPTGPLPVTVSKMASPNRISVGGLSETWSAPPRDGLDVPLVRERTTALLSRDPDLLGLIEVETRALTP